MSKISELRRELTKIQRNYHISERQSKIIDRESDQALDSDQSYVNLREELLLSDSRSAAFAAVASYIELLKAGGLVAGVRVYTQLKALRVIQQGLSVEENRSNFMKVFENVYGEEDALEELKKVAAKVFDYAVPYLVQQDAKVEKEFSARIIAHKNAISRGHILPLGDKNVVPLRKKK